MTDDSEGPDLPAKTERSLVPHERVADFHAREIASLFSTWCCGCDPCERARGLGYVPLPLRDPTYRERATAGDWGWFNEVYPIDEPMVLVPKKAELAFQFDPKVKIVGTSGQQYPILNDDRRYWELELTIADRGIVVVLGEDAEEVNRAVLSCAQLGGGDGAVTLALGFGDGLHWRRVEEAVRYLQEVEAHVVVCTDGSEQVIKRRLIHTQNPSVLDCLIFESARDVRERVLVVRSKERGGRGAVENLTEDQATMFYDAYAVGIRHVSEILRAHGLW